MINLQMIKDVPLLIGSKLSNLVIASNNIGTKGVKILTKLNLPLLR